MRRVLLIVFVVAIWGMVWCGPVHADAITTVHTFPLVPLESPGFVRLSAYTLHIELACQGDSCVVASRQTLLLHNRDRVEKASVLLGFAPSAEGAHGSDAILRTTQGATIPLVETSTRREPAWRIDLGRNERIELIYQTERTLSLGHYAEWRLYASSLAQWGLIEGTQISFRLPELVTDDCLIELVPPPTDFDGHTLAWEQENLQEPVDYVITMISPGTWDRLLTLRRSGEHDQLVSLLQELDADARSAGIAYSEPANQLMGELLSAVADQPESLDLRRELARRYRDLADSQADLALNYLLLSAQQLEEVLRLSPDEMGVEAQLAETYRWAAIEASERGDPAGALTYWTKSLPAGEKGVAPHQDLTSQKLRLRWAIDMAEQGQVAQAIDQLFDAFSPQTRDALLRYAPPLVSVHTQVDLTPQKREITYRFSLYGPTATESRAALDDMVSILDATEAVETSLIHEGDASTLVVGVKYGSNADLEKKATRITGHLSQENLLHVIVAIPWTRTPQSFAIERSYWSERTLYDEPVDLTPLTTVWHTESDFVRWRLIELQNTVASDELAELEQRLAVIALREQRHVWDHMVTGSYWTYVATHDAIASQPPLSWRVIWGQSRVLANERTLYYWPRIARAVGIALIILVALLIVPLLVKKLGRH